MKLTQKILAVCLMSTALLGSYGVWAQRSPSRSFTTDLAKADLAKKGVTTPTEGELATAESRIQQQRDAGMGWGQIANSLGLSLGAVVSAANRADQATQKAANKSAQSGQHGQSAMASSRSDTSADNSGGKGGGHGGGNGGGGGGGGDAANKRGQGLTDRVVNRNSSPVKRVRVAYSELCCNAHICA